MNYTDTIIEAVKTAIKQNEMAIEEALHKAHMKSFNEGYDKATEDMKHRENRLESQKQSLYDNWYRDGYAARLPKAKDKIPSIPYCPRITDSELFDLSNAHGRATKGNWKVEGNLIGTDSYIHANLVCRNVEPVLESSENWPKNSEFIVKIHNAFPALISRLLKAEKSLAYIHGMMR